MLGLVFSVILNAPAVSAVACPSDCPSRLKSTVAPGANPLPLNVKLLPGAPAAGVTVILGLSLGTAVTTRSDVALPSALSVARTVYVPGGVFDQVRTVKLRP